MSSCIFTSIALNYLPKARVLAESVKRHKPDAHFCVVLSEPVPAWLDLAAEPFDDLCCVEELAPETTRSWIFMHSLVELCTAVKGIFLDKALREEGFEHVFYFDPDIVLLGSMDELIARFAHASVLLTPHQLEPEQSDQAIRDNEIVSLQHGVYNLGFLGVANDAAGRRFAGWWRRRLTDYCRDDIPCGLFTDQRWVDLAVAFFEGVEIIRDPGCNVATWNLTHRWVDEASNGTILVNGQPITFYHFSGFDSGDQLSMLNRYGSDMPALYTLRNWYQDACIARAQDIPAGHTWPYGHYASGTEIPRQHREIYQMRADLQHAFPDPFNDLEPGSDYRDWFARRAPIEYRHADLLSESEARDTLAMMQQSRAWKIARILQRIRRHLAVLGI